jgi:site-specific DNA-methyltransferase (adenine-specific)
MIEENKLYNENCLDTMLRMEDNYLDCVITSPPYNVSIEYDAYDDNKPEEEYFMEMGEIFSTLYDKLKDDGRLALNLPFEIGAIGRQEERIFLTGEFYKMLRNIGYGWAGFVRLVENHSQCARRISQFGSYLSPSSPYIFNSEECVMILYKNVWKKQSKGISYFNEENKREFIDLIRFGWKYQAETNQLTKANFSLDLPLSALKILTWENDLVYDPFMGSGSTAIACQSMNRRWIGSELSTNYFNIANSRIKDFIDFKWRARSFF